MPAAASRPSPMRSQERDAGLDTLGGQLRHRGWTARVVPYRIGGDIDTRLEVRGPGSPAVEVLGNCADAPRHARWEAVQIAGGNRTVWCGPRHDCAYDDLIVFVEDLLQRDEDELTGRYLRLG